MGSTHFLTKRIQNVSTEMSLHVLAYNLRRMISIVGPNKLIAAMARKAYSLSLRKCSVYSQNLQPSNQFYFLTKKWPGKNKVA
jgi:hypothetical protein